MLWIKLSPKFGKQFDLFLSDLFTCKLDSFCGAFKPTLVYVVKTSAPSHAFPAFL